MEMTSSSVVHGDLRSVSNTLPPPPGFIRFQAVPVVNQDPTPPMQLPLPFTPHLVIGDTRDLLMLIVLATGTTAANMQHHATNPFNCKTHIANASGERNWQILHLGAVYQRKLEIMMQLFSRAHIANDFLVLLKASSTESSEALS